MEDNMSDRPQEPVLWQSEAAATATLNQRGQFLGGEEYCGLILA